MRLCARLAHGRPSGVLSEDFDCDDHAYYALLCMSLGSPGVAYHVLCIIVSRVGGFRCKVAMPAPPGKCDIYCWLRVRTAQCINMCMTNGRQ